MLKLKDFKNRSKETEAKLENIQKSAKIKKQESKCLIHKSVAFEEARDLAEAQSILENELEITHVADTYCNFRDNLVFDEIEAIKISKSLDDLLTLKQELKLAHLKDQEDIQKLSSSISIPNDKMIDLDPIVLNGKRFSEHYCKDESINIMYSEKYNQILNHFENLIAVLDQNLHELSKSTDKNMIRYLIELKKCYIKQGLSSDIFADRIKQLFPGYSKSSIQEIIDKIQSIDFAKQKRKAILNQYQYVIDKHIESCLFTFKQVDDSINSHENFINSMESRLEESLERHDKINKWKNNQKLNLEKYKAMDEYHSEMLKSEMDRINTSVSEARQRQSILINEFKTDRLRKQEHLQELLKAKEQERLQKYHENSDQNISRINYRQSVLNQRQRQLEDKRREREVEDLKIQKRLEKLRETVKVDIEADWNRILKETESINNSRKVTERNEGKVFGYTDDQVFKDPRLKLSYALSLAGLSESKVGRSALLSMKIKQVPSMTSSIKF